MWNLRWFLRDFGHDAELLERNEIDEKRWSTVSVRGSTRLTGLVVESADLPGALADQIKN